MKEKYFKYIDTAIEITFLLLVLFAPVYFDRRIGIVFSLSKATWIRALTLILLGLWVTKAFAGGGIKKIRTRLDIPVITYILSAAAATVLSINVYISFIGSYGRYEGLITLINYAVIFFMTTAFVTDEAKRRRIMIIAVMAGVIMSSYGLIQRLEMDPYAWGGVLTSERVIATIGQPNFLAAYLDMAFLLGLLLLFTLKSVFPVYRKEIRPKNKKLPSSFKWDWNEIIFQAKFALFYISVPAVFVYMIYQAEGGPALMQCMIAFLIMFGVSIYFSYNFERLDTRTMKVLLLLSLCLIFLGILSTQSRGGWFGLICGLAVFIMLCGRAIFFENKKTWAVLAAVCLLVTVFSFMKLGSMQAQRFLGEINVSERSGAAKLELKGAAGSRLETWTSALRFIPDRPVFGVGPEVIKMVFPQYETPQFRFKEGFHVKQDRCHNETLDMTVTRGLVTLFVYLFLLYQVFYWGVKKIRSDPGQKIMLGGLLGAMTAYLVQNQFSFGVVAITSLFWMLIGMTAGIASVEETKEKGEEKKAFKPDYLPVILVWIMIAAALYISAFPYVADKFYKSAKTETDSGQLESADRNYQRAMEFSAYEGLYYTNHGMAVMNARTGNRESDIISTRRAVSIFEKGQKADPYNADNFYMAARACLILADSGAADLMASAETYTRRAITIDPYYAEAYQNMGYISEKKGDTKTGIRYYEKAYISNPNLIEVGKAIYRYYSLSGQQQKAADVFDKVLEQNPGNAVVLLMIADLYMDMGRIEKAKSYYERILEADGSDVRGLTGMGMVYIRTGRQDKAYETFQLAMLSDPAYVPLHVGLGLYYLNKGDSKGARSEFEQVLSLDGSNNFATEMLKKIR